MPHSVDGQDKVVRLRISGGLTIDTFEHVLRKDPDSLLAELAKQQLLIDCAHRDGRLLRLLIDGLRKYIGETSESTFIPPEGFEEWRQLIAEARYWRLHRLEEAIQRASQRANTVFHR
ncbi:hypothetical protein DdX_00527 [Ditylenchus destructor]|uniref:Uncharacterized protein n=1 Tax=Ditylenchus destructor TaxID=166010 RepID=A0AAD4NIW4_9BILA|nr:hypothetical protein DdX_00527 [Ditylenchus destructor]